MIPLVNLSKEYKSEKKALEAAITQVFSSGLYLNGPQTSAFEKEFAKYLNVKHVLTVGSGTDAIILAMKSLGIQKGDEIILPANVYPPIFALIKAGFKPIFSDVNSNYLNLDLESLKKVKISKKTKAILFVHLYGNPTGIEEVRKFASENNLYLIEDCSHAAGAGLNNKMVGSFGDAGIFSFYPTKNLACAGEGGAVATNRSKIYTKMFSEKNNFEEKRFVSEAAGWGSNLDEIQAAILRVRLKLLDKYNDRRIKLANTYRNRLKGLPLDFIYEQKRAKNVYLNFVIRLKDRDKLKKYLYSKKILTQIHYPIPLHLQPSLLSLGYKNGDFPNSENASESVLSLPMNPFLNENEAKTICDEIRNYFKK